MLSENPFKLYGPFSQLLTLNNMTLKGALKDESLEIIEHAAILCEHGMIAKVGDYNTLKKENVDLKGEFIEINQPSVVLPGMVDAHTHICFAGSRAQDFALRNAGKSYLEIAKKGGGIWSTVINTRKAGKEELLSSLYKRVDRHMKSGVTTIEVKSGYGLSLEDEIKILETIADVQRIHKVDLISTCLAAHMVPKDFDGDEAKYLDQLIAQLLPEIKQRQLSHRVDIFIEQTAFSPNLAQLYLKQASDLGFDLTVHADQFTTSGSEVAVNCQALSADHLEASSEKEIENLARSNTIGIALPGASMGLGMNFTPARKLLDAGGALAIATDWNPGSAPMGDLLLQASVLSTYEKLSTAEVFAGITFRAAKALNLNDRGVIAPGKIADFIIFPTNDYREILYAQGKLMPELVVKLGKKVVD